VVKRHTAKAGIHCFAITAPPGEDPQAAVGYGLLSLASVSIAGVVQIGAGEAAKGLGEVLSTVELDDLRKRVEALLGETGKRVVVLIDDIDRLDAARSRQSSASSSYQPASLKL